MAKISRKLSRKRVNPKKPKKQTNRKPIGQAIDSRILRELDKQPEFRQAPTVNIDADKIPIVCEDIEGQGQTCELPEQTELPKKYKDMYIRADIQKRGQHFGKHKMVKQMLDAAYNWWSGGNKPICLIADLSARKFTETKGHKTHKTGEDGDFDLAKTLPKDKPFTAAKRKKCVIFMKCCLEAGFSRILFSDKLAVDTVNKWAEGKKLLGRAKIAADHDDHFHVDF